MIRPALAELVVLAERVADRDVHPFDVPALRDLTRLTFTSRATFFVGENGSGKSALLEAIAIAAGFGAEGGTRNFTARSTEHAGSSRPLADAMRLSWRKKARHGFFLRAESFFDVATAIDAHGAAHHYTDAPSLHARSHGESFLDLMVNRFEPGGLFLLDEPEAAVSPTRQLAVLRVMLDLLDASPDTQFIVSTHSPVLLALPGADVRSLAHGLASIPWEDAECVRFLRAFLADPMRWLDALDDP